MMQIFLPFLLKPIAKFALICYAISDGFFHRMGEMSYENSKNL